jgi:Domain of unknown function (DUF4116)
MSHYRTWLELCNDDLGSSDFIWKPIYERYYPEVSGKQLCEYKMRFLLQVYLRLDDLVSQRYCHDAFINDPLMQDSDFMLLAIKRNTFSLVYASPSLRNDRNFILRVLKQFPLALRYVHDIFKDDAELVSIAVNKDKSALKYASERLIPQQNIDPDDQEMILSLVSANGIDLQYASKTLQDNDVIVQTAVNQTGLALKFASERLRSDRHICLSAIKQTYDAWDFVSSSLYQNREFIKSCASLYIPREVLSKLKLDQDLILSLLPRHENIINYMDPAWNQDKDFMLAVLKRGVVVENAVELLLANYDINVLIEFNPTIMLYTTYNRDLVLKAVQRDGRILSSLNAEFRKDKAVVLTATLQNENAIWSADESLWRNVNFLIAALSPVLLDIHGVRYDGHFNSKAVERCNCRDKATKHNIEEYRKLFI